MTYNTKSSPTLTVLLLRNLCRIAVDECPAVSLKQQALCECGVVLVAFFSIIVCTL
jgi:hypothetical protein